MLLLFHKKIKKFINQKLRKNANFRISLTTCQKIEIRDLSTHNDILPMKLGTARIIHSHQHFIHIIKLQDYVNNVDKIQKSIDILKGITDITNNSNYIFHINKKFHNLEHKLNTLLSRTRNKKNSN